MKFSRASLGIAAATALTASLLLSPTASAITIAVAGDSCVMTVHEADYAIYFNAVVAAEEADIIAGHPGSADELRSYFDYVKSTTDGEAAVQVRIDVVAGADAALATDLLYYYQGINAPWPPTPLVQALTRIEAQEALLGTDFSILPAELGLVEALTACANGESGEFGATAPAEPSGSSGSSGFSFGSS